MKEQLLEVGQVGQPQRTILARHCSESLKESSAEGTKGNHASAATPCSVAAS